MRIITIADERHHVLGPKHGRLRAIREPLLCPVRQLEGEGVVTRLGRVEAQLRDRDLQARGRHVAGPRGDLGAVVEAEGLALVGRAHEEGEGPCGEGGKAGGEGGEGSGVYGGGYRCVVVA